MPRYPIDSDPQHSKDLYPDYRMPHHAFWSSHPGAVRSRATWRGPEQYRRNINLNMPEVEIYDEGDTLAVEADVPGLTASDIRLEVQGDCTLEIEGTANLAKSLDSSLATYARPPRRDRSFLRRLELPCPVDGDEARAHYENGILSVVLPKKQNGNRCRLRIDPG